MAYTLTHVATAPSPTDTWDSPAWSQARTASLTHVHARSSDHHPAVRVRLLYTDAAIHGLFHVQDRYVLARRTAFQDGVCRDSCVEFFVEPPVGRGYFNLEVNCVGTALLHHMKSSEGPGVPVSADWSASLNLTPSLPREPILEEIAQPTTWTLGFTLPFALLEAYTKQPCGPTTTGWRANFYKCADHSSHPHWLSWQSVGEPLSFHKPQCFGDLVFAAPSAPWQAVGHDRASRTSAR